MPKIIKSGHVIRTDDVVIIPDIDPAHAFQAEGDTDGMAVDEQQGDDDKEASALDIEKDRVERLMLLARQERDEILTQAEKGAIQIREQARREGYQAGRQEVTDRVNAALTEVRELLDELANRQHAYFVDYHKELRFLSLDIAGKIMGNVVSRDDTAMAELVKQAVAMIKGSDWVTVELSDRLTGLISALTQEFATQYPARQIEIVGGAMADDVCIIKTNEGVIDASVPAQIENLRSLFCSMDDSDR